MANEEVKPQPAPKVYDPYEGSPWDRGGATPEPARQEEIKILPFGNDPTDQSQKLLDEEMEGMLYAAEAEIKTMGELQTQRGTPIPALFNTYYKFISNPSSVSVETFKRMVDTDDTIGSGVDFLVTCLAARMGAYQHEDSGITAWVNRALEDMEDGFLATIKEILSATWVGFSVSEIVWQNNDNGFVPKRVVTLPPGTIMFEVDRTGRLTKDGILQYQRNYNPALFGTGSSYLFGFGNPAVGDRVGRTDPWARFGDLPFPMRVGNTYAYLSIRIPRQKCIHYAFDAQGRFGNPYGRSLLRRAYKWYVMKDSFLQMLSIALDRKGTPLTLVWADPNKTVIDTKNFTGPKDNNALASMRADRAAHEAFKNVHNDSVVVLPGKKGQVYDVDTLSQQANASDFLDAIKMCNAAIMRALLIPSLIFTNGDGTGSNALGQEHAKTFDKILDGWLAGCTQAILKQLIEPMLMYNYPEKLWRKHGLGSFSKRQLTSDEISKECEIFETLTNIGAVDPQDLQDLNHIREVAGFEHRDTPIEKPQTFDPFNPMAGGTDPNAPGGGDNPFEAGGEDGQGPDPKEGNPFQTGSEGQQTPPALPKRPPFPPKKQ